MVDQTDRQCVTETQANIMYNTRFFWRQMVYWSRAFLNSAFNGIGNIEETFARLFVTPPPYAQMLQLILGRSFRDKYVSLLSGYTVLLRELVEAVLAGQTELVNQKVSELYGYARERAEFLSGVFPTIDKDVLEEMLITFVQYEIQEINAYITGDYNKLVEVYDNLSILSDNLADYFSKGIIDLITAAPAPGVEISQGSDICITDDQLNTILDLALTWVELVMWFRVYRVSLMAGVGDQEVLYNRLLQVPVDFGNRIRSFINDDEIVDRQVVLMQEYLGIINRLLSARIADNVEEMNLAYQLAMDNINVRAELLSSEFPLLDETEWRNQLYKMHSTLMGMGGAFLSGDFAANIAMFDGLIKQAEELGFYFVESLFDTIISPA